MVALAHPNPFFASLGPARIALERDPRMLEEAAYLDRFNEHVLENLRYLRDAQIRALDIDFAGLDFQLDRLSALSVGWDGYDAPKPAEAVLGNARRILKLLQSELMMPRQITASAEGGVAFSFGSAGDRRAQIEILNNGEQFAHLYDLRGNSSTIESPQDDSPKAVKGLLGPIIEYLRL